MVAVGDAHKGLEGPLPPAPMKPYRGPPMTLDSAAAAKLVLGSGAKHVATAANPMWPAGSVVWTRYAGA
jgi:hypothetical protein